MGSKKNRSDAPVCQLKITLKDSRPPIWRRIQVAGDTSLAKLHRILQIVMGWTDSHLHQFTIHGCDYGVPDPDFEAFGHSTINEKSTKLGQVIQGEKDHFIYEYDFGDSWTHRIVVEKITPAEEGKRYPVCLGGKRACPPEDCGGIWGYENFIEAVSDPDHEEHEDMLEWIGGGFDTEAFDLDDVNLALRHAR